MQIDDVRIFFSLSLSLSFALALALALLLAIDRESREMYNSLFVDLSLSEGKHISKTERKRRNLMHDKSLIYGEVCEGSIALSSIRVPRRFRGSEVLQGTN